LQQFFQFVLRNAEFGGDGCRWALCQLVDDGFVPLADLQEGDIFWIAENSVAIGVRHPLHAGFQPWGTSPAPLLPFKKEGLAGVRPVGGGWILDFAVRSRIRSVGGESQNAL
jgi:hypothetical protein